MVIGGGLEGVVGVIEAFAGLDRNRTRSSRRIEEPKWAATGGLRATVA
ncbi:hypothetical protein AG0111_0g522 [Alternaria gaisen]|uniref:Uncharacterized protein n=1 Tax=Alternaria gaisen TaxID=167740 RepID=A0ACB6G245_9PLEO|nr:hypothetical protein AG0111_0g522 [Alternaria gaisen]